MTRTTTPTPPPIQRTQIALRPLANYAPRRRTKRHRRSNTPRLIAFIAIGGALGIAAAQLVLTSCGI